MKILFASLVIPLFLFGFITGTDGQATKRNVLLDVDTSGDDIMAILYLLSQPEIDIKGISIVRGVSDVEKGTEIVLRLLNLTGHRDIPVVKGADKPMEGSNAFPAKWQPAVDKPFGLLLPACNLKASEIPAPEMIASLLKTYKGNIDILAIGPLTNIAHVFQNDPSLEKNIRELFISDGAVYIPGAIHMEYPSINNVVSGWNQWVDPKAADIVFSAHTPISLVPLDITAVHAPAPLLLTSTLASRFGSLAANKSSRALSSVFDYWITYYHTDTKINNTEEQAPVWDLVAAEILCNDQICSSWQQKHVRIATGDPEKAGQILLSDEGEKNVRICICGNQGLFDAALIKVDTEQSH